ncbi:MAG TPA: DICT sensory domain-containing protein [Segeticoccus sp.]|jgi:DICT domain-containing protein|nr:DICT sensory domain-containing protein [Segeticoccus sp.]
MPRKERAINEDRRAAGLSIGELARRTGVPQATLRTWEARHGVPVPERLPGGHRRYAEHDVSLVQEILRRRASGLSMEAAVQQLTAASPQPDTSVFAGLRRRHPELQATVLRKSSLLALTRAIEDECCARAERPALFASFQHRRFYRQSEQRWRELARTAAGVVVFADFPRRSATGRWPLQVPVRADAPLRREWALVCDCPDYPAVVAGWEHPGQLAVADAERRFETVWTVDPVAVRHAAEVSVGLATHFLPSSAARLEALLTGRPAPVSADLRRAAGLLDRMLAYLEHGH